MPLDPKRLRVIGQKNISHLFRIIGGSGRDSITVNGCAGADRRMLPPYVVYSAKNLRDAWTIGRPQGCRYNCSDKGWMDSTVFVGWFEELFLKSIPSERPVILFFDGHKSHTSVRLIQSAMKNRVILLKLPPNSTHTLQPLDVGVYGPLKTQ
ncbi:pogo transposable element with krab domain [Plakobranchus ocellatus]|uniref:Pogo transposable element with krab domain n=1 Tax=Plakobranchus ocellatus TaxID=259542 RepID=A0AAV4D9V2_9GAST|nr:pogo transposable element with krab domain [Plakobranchus ocellatus]